MQNNSCCYSLRPSEAKFMNIPDSDLPHDFFVVIDIADREFKSTVNRNSGLNPHWSDSFSLQGLENAIATVKVYDRDIAHSDHLMGENIFSLSNIDFDSKRIHKRIDLTSDEVKVGEILLEFEPELDKGASEPLKRRSSFIDKIKEEVGVIGEKISLLGRSIEEKLGFIEKAEHDESEDSKNFSHRNDSTEGIHLPGLGKSRSYNENHKLNIDHFFDPSEESVSITYGSKEFEDANTTEGPTLLAKGLELLESFGGKVHDILNREPKPDSDIKEPETEYSGIDINLLDKGMQKLHDLGEQFDHAIENNEHESWFKRTASEIPNEIDDSLLDKGIGRRTKSLDPDHEEKIRQWHEEADKHPETIHMKNDYLCPERGFVFGD